MFVQSKNSGCQGTDYKTNDCSNDDVWPVSVHCAPSDPRDDEQAGQGISLKDNLARPPKERIDKSKRPVAVCQAAPSGACLIPAHFDTTDHLPD
jgi:hypothetical protein